MEFKIRSVKTASGKIAVQVFTLTHRKRNIVKHFGSAENKKEIDDLIEKAKLWIQEEINNKGLFREENHFDRYYEYLGFTYSYGYEFLEKIYLKFNFNNHLDKLFKDLTIARILEPRSKRDTLEFLDIFVGIRHSENVLYKSISMYEAGIKDKVEKEIVRVARKEFGFDFSFVLYDVTTLYFESFKNDEFKRPGFSKDHKHNQPQIVIGLIVTKEGFPISYEIFKGNTFEGNTFLPSILDFKKRHAVSSLTVVADSAMLSKQNLDALVASGLNYIISSRLASLKDSLIEQIDVNLKRTDHSNIRIDNLIVDYSDKRYRKDKKEFDKQVEKAKLHLHAQTEKISRIKYLNNDKVRHHLNQKLIDKNMKLLGLKGYVTNLDKETNQEIADYYHNLFKIEHAFRIAKSDLEARPIYHHKEESIKNHILICFIALAISAYLEIRTEKSIASVVEKIKSVTDAKILNKITGKIFSQRVKGFGKAEELEKMLH